MKLIATLFALTLAAHAQIQGVAVPLFNGKDLTGWKGEGYEVKDGAIVATAQSRNLVTESIFANYYLDFEFRLDAGANSGIGIHYPGEGDAAYVGMEIQVLDDGAEQYAKLEPGQYHGSIYKLVAAKRGHLKPVGEWNVQRITVTGPLVKVELNGTVIAEGNLDALSQANPQHQGVKRRAGHIALCGHGAGVAFRNMTIGELPPQANIEGVKAAGFTNLFDGTTLKGWKVDKGSEDHWRALNAIIKYDGRSEAAVKDLWSEKSYKDFTLVFDWRWSAPGPVMKRPIIGPDGKETGEMVDVQELDSGIYLRGSSKSQVNLWNWPCGSGEVYGYRTDGGQSPEVRAGVTPTANADRPVGEWNRMMIQLRGEVLTVTLNGKDVIENATLPGIPAEGPIGLQHHGAAIDFANIWIKEH
jgi:uncharacterized protein (DUF427 family)